MAISKLGWAGIGLVAGAAGVAYAGSREYASLRQYANSVAQHSLVVDSTAHKLSDSTKILVTALSQKKTTIVTRVKKDTAAANRLDSAVRAAKTSTDSIQALVQEVVVLKSANVGLYQALAIADSISRLEHSRGDSLQTMLDSANVQVRTIAKKIDALHGTPKWLSISFEVLKIGGAAYAGYKVGQHNH